MEMPEDALLVIRLQIWLPFDRVHLPSEGVYVASSRSRWKTLSIYDKRWEKCDDL